MKTSLKVLAVIAGSIAMLAAAAPMVQLKVAPESKIWVSGNSSVKSFRCASPAQDAALLSPETENADLAKLVAAADVKVSIEKLDCGTGTMNEHMRKALNMKSFPTITFKLSSYQITSGTIDVKGLLTINGQEHAVELAGKVSEEGGVIRTAATKDIDMTQWGVKPPSLMLGTMKVKPVVTIGYDLVVKR
jgi:polyisoprenoid-binding protein YceI